MCTKIPNPMVFVDDITNGQENVQIPFVNEINYQKFSDYVTYSKRNILTSESLVEDFESIPLPCTCEDLCTSDCSCVLGESIAYHNDILLEEFISDASKPIIECSDLCTCQRCCSNCVVQKGITKHLQVFMTEFKGFGVRALELIPKLSFVCEYAGELIDKAEAEKRMKDRSPKEPNYIFILNEHSPFQSSTFTIVDPTNYGNVGRYLNHSCSPNLIPVPVRVDCMIPRICFFAKRDIMPYEEITYHYGVDVAEGDDAANGNRSFTKCHCQSFECLGVLPFDAKYFS